MPGASEAHKAQAVEHDDQAGETHGDGRDERVEEPGRR